MNSQLPANTRIGVLDSGVGGLSVLREIHRLLPSHPTIYFADSLHFPYGPRLADEIYGFVETITRFLLERGAVVIVLACNAASAASLLSLRAHFPNVPFVGMEPAIKPAVESTEASIVGVLTTQATADGPLYRRVLERFASGAQVVTQVAPQLVHIAETNSQHTIKNQRIIRRHIRPLLDAGADRIVLACTHFPFLAESIQAVAGPDIQLVDPGPAVARQTARVWPEGVAPAQAENAYFTSGSPDHLRKMLQTLIGVDDPVTGVAELQV